MQRLTLSVSEAARALGVHRVTVYQAIELGEIPALRVGRRLLVPRKALAALLETAPASPAGRPR